MSKANEIVRKNGQLELILFCFFSDSYESVDLGLRTLRYILEKIEDQHQVASKNLYHLVPIALPALFETFTNEEIGVPEREQILNLFYMLIRLVAWADGRDNELVEDCLGETF